MPEPKPFDIDQLFEGSLRRLRTEAKFFSRLTDHSPELGRLNETHLVKLLRAYLPPKIGIGTGFIASGGENPGQSPQCDIVLYDALNNVPLYQSEAWSIYPIEMVYGIVEVKTKLNLAELEDAFKKCSKIRTMAKSPDGDMNKAYILQMRPEPNSPARYELGLDGLPPRFFVFGYDGWKTIRGLETNFRKLSERYEDAHIHGVCNLNEKDSLYVHHRAFEKGEARYSQRSENGFRHLLANLSATLESMLPLHRKGLGFDRVYLGHYALKIE